ncbi:pyridoxal-phosphate dependent enzyme [Aquamicrobium sp. LC103]|nr:pyridoxal-phosphate dependent enzyme [Aquamicrobium sp. LC103]
MRCIRCQACFPVADYLEGCPACLASSLPSSLVFDYRLAAAGAPFNAREWLVYASDPQLGEGDTPLVELPRLASDVGIARLTAKYEGANPTGSHKDRMSALFIQRAKSAGFPTVAIASSGNAGVSLAAYAAAAGIECVVVTTEKMTDNWRRAIEMHGARLIATSTVDDRWHLIAGKARAGEWYPATNYIIPAVGSNPFGVDGYRAIAFEMFLQWQDAPATDVLVPTSRGDVLWGVARGFHDLRQAGYLTDVPRVHAVEPFPRIERVLSGEDYRTLFSGQTLMTSLGGSTVAYQALDALRMAGGSAVAVNEPAVIEDQRRLALEGLYLELSSASALTGLRSLMKRNVIPAGAHAVLIATSHGYKEEPSFTAPIPIFSG